ncbi:MULTISPECIES: hypothetical protein [unclassified Pseudomonas]|uniref:hypothetical protein n=1 Tax=unclassified Pseudomonas TaxID=196821 RepID=UPI00119EBEE7|nr:MULTISPECIES: hypothetical protein [unclassified Pseudomonas]
MDLEAGLSQARALRLLGMALVSVVFSGCISYTEKEAEGMPDSDIALIGLTDKTLFIASVDGRKTNFALGTQTEYRLTAGRHRLELRYWVGTTKSLDRKIRDVNLVAGRTYKLTTAPSNTWWDMIIVDTSSGERVDQHVPRR